MASDKGCGCGVLSLPLLHLSFAHQSFPLQFLYQVLAALNPCQGVGEGVTSFSTPQETTHELCPMLSPEDPSETEPLELGPALECLILPDLRIWGAGPLPGAHY